MAYTRGDSKNIIVGAAAPSSTQKAQFWTQVQMASSRICCRRILQGYFKAMQAGPTLVSHRMVWN